MAHPQSPTETKFRDAITLLQQGRLIPARTLCGEVLRDEPTHCQALQVMGIIALRSGDPQSAIEFITRAITLSNRDSLAYCNRALAMRATGQWLHALSDLDRAIAIDGNLPGAHLWRGRTLEDLHRWEEALASYDRTLQLDPHHAEAHASRGNVHCQLNQWDAALASYDRAIERDPANAALYSNRGAVRRQLSQWVAALADLDRALELAPDYALAHSNRGEVLRQMNRMDDALQAYDRAIARAPQAAEACYNRGSLLHFLQRLPECLQDYDRALSIKPTLLQARFNRACAALQRGDFDLGWREFECRKDMEPAAPNVTGGEFPGKRWIGQENLRAKTILLSSEYGLGDTIQFCRYATPLADRGATVILQVQKPLVNLLTSLAGVTRVLPAGEIAPRADYWCPLLSLPYALGTTLSSIPADIPYLRAPERKIRDWKESLGYSGKLRVGLVWAGGFRPHQPETWLANERRNIPLRQLAILRNEHIEFFSLQKGEAAVAELAAARSSGWEGPQISEFTDRLEDFSDTAALIENLDLVISVDTSVAHLAGALGKPTWLLNRYDTCWRWLSDRLDSPWYPTLRLYRQQQAGDWERVLRNVNEELVRLVAGDKLTPSCSHQ